MLFGNDESKVDSFDIGDHFEPLQNINQSISTNLNFNS